MTKPRDGAQDQDDVQDDQIDDIPDEGLSEPAADEADIALDRTEEETARRESEDRAR